MTEDNQDPNKMKPSATAWRRFLSFFTHEPEPSTAHKLYAVLVDHARFRVYYETLAVPDTPEGRFEVLALHVGLVLRRLVQDRSVGGHVAQSLVDLMVTDMDVNLRELGVGDLSVGKQVKRLAGQLNARMDVLREAFDGGDHERLRPMLAVNTYHGVDAPPESGVTKLIRACAAIEKRLAEQDVAALAAGRLQLPDEGMIRETCLAT